VIGAKVNKTWNILLRLLIVVATLWYIYTQVFYERDTSVLLDFFETLRDNKSLYLYLVVLFLLMFANQALEAYKWQMLIGKLEKLKFGVALEAVFTGISVSMFLPNRMGDYFGRVFMLRKADPVKGILVTMVGSIAQLITTAIAGLIAGLFFLHSTLDFSLVFNRWIYAGAIVVAVLATFVSLLFYFNIQVLRFLANKVLISWKSKVEAYVEVFTLFEGPLLLRVLLLSALRYMVFSFQFYLFILLFGIHIGYFNAMMLIALTYLLITIIPTIALTELGVRGTVSVYLFSLYFSSIGLLTETITVGILASSTAIWLLNIAFPALLGVLFVYRLKFFRRRNGHVG
jgi:uncharacterized membrane protein YbhN (UPF0104 family)